MERRLLQDYRARLADLVAQLTVDNYAVAVKLACLPDQIRGFGHVRLRHIEAVKQQELDFLKELKGRPRFVLPQAAE